MHHITKTRHSDFDLWNMPISLLNNTEQKMCHIILLAWVASELLIWIFTSFGRGTNRNNSDKGSYWGIVLGYFFSIAASCSFTGNTNRHLPDAFFWIGFILMAIGIGLRCFSVWTLKSAFSLSVTVKSDQPLIKSGPYKYLRHPAYTGSIMTLLGFSFVLKANWAPFVVIGICACVYGYRIYVEEKLMLKEFGDQYKEYSKTTWRLIPWVW